MLLIANLCFCINFIKKNKVDGIGLHRISWSGHTGIWFLVILYLCVFTCASVYLWACVCTSALTVCAQTFLNVVACLFDVHVFQFYLGHLRLCNLPVLQQCCSAHETSIL